MGNVAGDVATIDVCDICRRCEWTTNSVMPASGRASTTASVSVP